MGCLLFRCPVIVAVLLVCLLPEMAPAETAVSTWTAFSRKDGLAHNWVTSIAQTSDGAIWFGTMGGGISRYDGRTWRTFDESTGLPGNGVGTLYVGETGEVWATTEATPARRAPQHLVRFDGERWTSISLPDELTRAGIRQIVGVGDEAICFATRTGGILHFDGDSWKAITADDGLLSNSVSCLLRTEDGRMLAAHGQARSWGRRRQLEGMDPSPAAISGLDPATGQWSPLEEGAVLPGMSVRTMAQAADGAIWLGTLNGGVARIDAENWRIYTTEDGLPSDRVHVVACARDGSVWVGTNAGIARIGPTRNGHEGQWRTFTEADGIPSNYVTSLHISADNSVWVGTVGGAARYNQTGWVHHDEWTGKGDRGGVAMVLDASGGLWAATGEGLYRLSDGQWQSMARLEAYSGRVVDLLADRAGALWWATPEALVRYHDGRAEQVALPGVGVPNWTLAIAAGNGGLWTGTLDGAFRYDAAAWSPVDLGESGPVIAVHEVMAGDVWFGMRGGLVRLAGEERSRYDTSDGLPEGPVIGIGSNVHGEPWVSTLGGVAHFDGTAWRTVPESGETMFNRVLRFHADSDGTMWLASPLDGAIHTDGMAWTRYTLRNGLPGSQVWDICEDANGQLWFATDGGLGCYLPDVEPPETILIAPPSQIAPFESVLLRLGGHDAWMRTPSLDLQFSWRLDGGSWSRFTSDNRVLLTGVTAGRHLFQARAMDREFNVDPVSAEHAFVVLAPVWQQTWFVLLTTALLVALSVSIGYAWQRHRRWRQAQDDLIRELESELQQAHDMQMGLLPKGVLREPDLEIAGACAPANHVGGDYYTYYWLDDDRRWLGFGAADVSGKGMEAAVSAMRLSSMFRYEFRGDRATSEVCRGLDAVLKEQLDAASFVTCCLGKFDRQTGDVHLVNAAHPFPYHFSAISGDLRPLEMPSLPLGLTLPAGSPGGHCNKQVRMEPGDLLLFYSDGVTDMQNDRGDFYEEHRLEEVIQREAHGGVEHLVQAVVEDLRRFQGGAPQPDDITLLALKRLGHEGSVRPV